MAEAKQKVLISILHMGWVRYELLLQMVALSHDYRYDLKIEVPSDQPISSNRNGICLHARQDIDADWVLMVDADARLNGNPLDAIERDPDVFAWPALCYKAGRFIDEGRDPFVWNLVNHDRFGNPYDSMDTEQPVERGAVGAHVMLIARRVLEHPKMQAPFMDEFDNNGIRLSGEALLFCFRAREAGFKVWVDLGHPAGHMKEIDLLTARRVIDGVKHGVGGDGG